MLAKVNTKVPHAPGAIVRLASVPSSMPVVSEQQEDEPKICVPLNVIFVRLPLAVGHIRDSPVII